MNKLDSLKNYTTVVADTGDFQAIAKYKPEDSTTNPSLIYAATQMPEYQDFTANIINSAKGGNGGDIDAIIDELIVSFGAKLTENVTGYVSTEVDASLSFDTEKTIAKAKQLLDLYAQKGVDKSRILIKIASTWEGIQAAKQLEKEGIKCNLTLLFNLPQAAACAEAGAFLISPFVGRILDWYKDNGLYNDGDMDPGVVSVRTVYSYYKQFGYNTIIMGASFRNTHEIEQLCGIDRLTISPKLLDELQNSPTELTNQMAQVKTDLFDEKINVTEANFRFLLNEDAMATEKLSQGIRQFNKDTQNLKDFVADYLK